MMNIRGYVICCPINTWGDDTKDKWFPQSYTFGTTAQEAWIRFLMSRHSISVEHSDWYRFQNEYVSKGYCPKKAYMEIEVE